jgi:hypothetical protein
MMDGLLMIINLNFVLAILVLEKIKPAVTQNGC